MNNLKKWLAPARTLLLLFTWTSAALAAEEVTQRAVPGPLPSQIPLPAVALRPLPKLIPTPGVTLQTVQQQTVPAGVRKQPPLPRPRVQDLVSIIESLPGGRQVVQDAARRGARISPAAQSSPSTPQQPAPAPMSLVPGQGIVLAGAQVSGFDAIRGGFVLSNSPVAEPNGGTITKPYAKFGVCLQTDGWYLIEIAAESFGTNPTQVRANLYQDRDAIDNNALGTDALVFSWDYSGRPLESAPTVFPALVEVTAGCYRFFWSLEHHFVRFHEVRITPL